MILVFGDFEIDLALCELRRRSTVVPVQPKVFRLLAYLAQHPNRVVPREELFEALWPRERVGESSLTRAVRIARVALGDRGDSQRMIRTIRSFGYRLMPAVEERFVDAQWRSSHASVPFPGGQIPSLGGTSSTVSAMLALVPVNARP